MLGTGQAMIDTAGLLVGVDTGFCDMLRRDADDIVGISILAFTAPGDRAECEAALNEMVRTKRQVSATKRYSRGDGTTIWVAATASIILLSEMSDRAILHATPIVDLRAANHPARLLECARQIQGHNVARTNVIDHALLPAWGAVLAAYIAEAEGRLFLTAGTDLLGFGSPASVSRWTAALVHEGIFEVETRNLDPDAVKSYRLTSDTQARLEEYLRQALLPTEEPSIVQPI